MERRDTVWQDRTLVQTFLTGVRGGLPLAAEQIDVMLRLIAARGEPPRRFADLGCGDGVLAAAIHARYPEAAGTLVDFSEPMLERARERFADASASLRFVPADLGDLAWRDAVGNGAPFDVVVSGFAIHHLPDERKRALYQEIFEVLQPGGVFVNIEHVASPTPWLATVFDELLIDSLAAFHERTGTGKSRGQVADEYVHRPDKAANILAPVETQCAWLREIGFRNVDCSFKVFELAVFGGQRP